MARYSLEVDTGLVDIDLKDKNGNILGSFEFSPTDSDIMNRYQNVVKAFNDIEAPAVLLDGTASDEEKDNFYNSFSQTIKEQIDYLLAHKVSDRIFAVCGPLTLLDNGDFYYEHVIEGIGNLIGNIMDERIDVKLKKVRDAVSKYDHE